jgi:hypothetical protein
MLSLCTIIQMDIGTKLMKNFHVVKIWMEKVVS